MMQMVPASVYSGELQFPVMHVSVQSVFSGDGEKPVVFVGGADDDGEEGEREMSRASER